jgi:hypothetical protein
VFEEFEQFYRELAEIDPSTDRVAARYPLTGCKGSHGLLIDSEDRLAFAACKENSKLVVFDLQSKKATATFSVGADPDVLAFDIHFIVYTSLRKAATKRGTREVPRFAYQRPSILLLTSRNAVGIHLRSGMP